MSTTHDQHASSVTITRTPRVLVGLCAAVMLFEGYDLFSYGAVVPSLLADPDWGLSPSRAGFIGSAGVFGMLVGALVAGVLTDRFGRKAMFLGAVATFSLGMGLCALSTDSGALLLARIVVGVGGGGFLPTAVAYVVECSPQGRRAFNVSVIGSGIAAGGVVAAVLATWLIPEYGHRAMFVVGVLPLLIVPALYRWLPESISYLVANGRRDEARTTISRHRLPMTLAKAIPTEKAQRHPGTAPAFVRAAAALFTPHHLRATVVFWLGTAACMMLIFGTNTWLPTIMLRAGYGLTSSLAFLAALNAGVIIGSLLASRLADRSGPRAVIVVGFASCAAALLALSVKPSLALTFALVVIVGFGAGGTQNLVNAYIGIYYDAALRGTGVGAALAFGRIGGILGPTYAGWLIANSSNSDASFYAFAAAAAFACVVFMMGPALRHHSSPTAAVPDGAPAVTGPGAARWSADPLTDREAPA